MSGKLGESAICEPCGIENCPTCNAPKYTPTYAALLQQRDALKEALRTIINYCAVGQVYPIIEIASKALADSGDKP
jgi:hypothetical protein